MNSKDMVPIVDAGRLPNYNRIFDLMDISEPTRQDYKSRIPLFLEFVKGNGFNRNSFLEFKRFLAEKQNFSVSTKNKYLVVSRIFLKELAKQGILPVDITMNIKTFQSGRKHKKEGLAESEVKMLVEKVNQMPVDAKTARIKAFLSLLLLQGLREIELTRLDIGDLDFVSRTLLVHGKGRDDKEVVYMQPETVKVLKEYIRLNRVSSGPLFFSRSNNSRGRRLTTRALRIIVTEILRELGIDKTVHGCRHFFTSQLIKTYKGDLMEVSRYTRHRSIETLQIYNDNLALKADLPRFYQVFDSISFS